jgi:Tfp pilus assembly protein PilF
MSPASQPVAPAAVPAEAEVAALSLNNGLNTPPESAAVASKPLLILAPIISAVSPSPVISLGLPQAVTITGSHYASDATVTLRSPKGKAYTKRKIVMQDAAQIVISANFGDLAGIWSVEVVNGSGHSADHSTSAQTASGQFPFTVLPDPASIRPQLKAALPAAKATRSAAKPAPVETTPVALSAGKVSKQPTQVTPQQQAENEFRKAYALMQQGQITAAISGYETALQLDAGHIVARQTLVRLLLDNKRSVDAERLLQQGLQLDPKQSSLAMLLARMQVGRNELPQALEAMRNRCPMPKASRLSSLWLPCCNARAATRKPSPIFKAPCN